MKSQNGMSLDLHSGVYGHMGIESRNDMSVDLHNTKCSSMPLALCSINRVYGTHAGARSLGINARSLQYAWTGSRNCKSLSLACRS